jgi:hypothetical protein
MSGIPSSDLNSVVLTAGKLVKVGDSGIPAEATDTDADIHDAVTKAHVAASVSNTSSINLALSGQQISANANFGTTAGTICQGNDSRLSGSGGTPVNLQSSTPGTQQTGNSNISGKAISQSLEVNQSTGINAIILNPGGSGTETVIYSDGGSSGGIHIAFLSGDGLTRTDLVSVDRFGNVTIPSLNGSGTGPVVAGPDGTLARGGLNVPWTDFTSAVIVSGFDPNVLKWMRYRVENGRCFVNAIFKGHYTDIPSQIGFSLPYEQISGCVDPLSTGVIYGKAWIEDSIGCSPTQEGGFIASGWNGSYGVSQVVVLKDSGEPFSNLNTLGLNIRCEFNYEISEPE